MDVPDEPRPRTGGHRGQPDRPDPRHRRALPASTERSVQKIIADLEQEGYLSHTREGRGNTYRIEPGKVLRHPAEAGLTVAALLSLLDQDEAARARRPAPDTGGDADAPDPRREHDGQAHRSSRTDPNAVAVKRDQGHEYVSDI